ncbi:aminodeoxychorismate/anthranilate synthase component II [Myxococcota bacterium]|nr:aminodeoxychorismate/anthranilate synthase component II [Myxococcota bacterium]
MFLLIDNYDSFVYNLARYLGILGKTRQVIRNDALSLAEIEALQPEAIVISPGPCSPDQAGISLDIVRHFGPKLPILGVCLGHQCIGQVYGGSVLRAIRPIHGQTSPIQHDRQGLFLGLPEPLEVARYHSLIVVCKQDSPLVVTAHTEQGEIMALQHPVYPSYGVQFHPESVLTPHGLDILRNFLRLAEAWWQARPTQEAEQTEAA